MTTQRNRRGMALIDVLLGVVLLTIAGIAFTTLLGQNFMTVDQLRHREREITGAAEQLERMSAFWSARDFESRIGASRAGAYVATVSAIAPNLYEVAIADTLVGVILLKTTMYAVDTLNVAR